MSKKDNYGEFNHFGGLDYNRLPHISHRYSPYYDEQTDFQTNAKSYYDYLARFNASFKSIIDHVNNATGRGIEVNNDEYPVIELMKEGSWIDFDKENIITLSAKLNIDEGSTTTKEIDGERITVRNGLKINPNGLYTPDVMTLLRSYDNWIKKLQNKITVLENNNNDVNVDDVVQSYLGRNRKRLTKGIDYELEWFNGFYTETTDLVVEVNERPDQNELDVYITTNSALKHILKNDDIVTKAEMSHSPFDYVPEKSLVFNIIFKGKYLGYKKSIVANRSRPSLWNLAPSNKRATGEAGLNPHIVNSKIRFSWQSLSDGYNSTLDVYNDNNIYLDFGNLDIMITVKGD